MKINISSRMYLYFGLLLLGVGGFFFTLILPQPQGFYAFIILAALAGLGVSMNIWDTKRHHRQLVCPTGSDCNIVVNSRYSKFFGISLEYWGMAYFALLIPLYLGLIFVPMWFTGWMVLGVVFLSVSAGLFSLYLLFVQGVLIKSWCIWCLLAALMSLMICVLSLTSFSAAIDLLSQSLGFIGFLEYLGYIFGAGGATAAIFLFSRYLGDERIDERELSSLKGVYEMMWVGVALLLVSQYAFFISFPSLLGDPAFVAQIIALLVIILAAAGLMIILAPFIVFVPFGPQEEEASSASSETGSQVSFVNLRMPTIVTGTIILTSWYLMFGLNFLPNISFVNIMIIYVAVTGILAYLFTMLTNPQPSD